MLLPNERKVIPYKGARGMLLVEELDAGSARFFKTIAGNHVSRIALFQAEKE